MALLLLGDKSFPIPDGGELLLGRGADCAVKLDEHASQRHARVFHRDGGWWVEDLESASGTKLNGRALITGPSQLKEGDLIVIGDATLKFQVVDDLKGKRAPTEMADDAALVGQTFGGNRLDQFMGRGLTGALYKAWSEARKRNVTVKVIDKRLTADPEFAARFKRDLTIAAGIDHPSAVRIFQCALSEGRLWYSMEPVEGENLANLILKPIPHRKAIELVIAIGKALEAYHEGGVVHGDVRPASVAIDAKGGVRLLDNGLIGVTNEEARMLQADAVTRQVFYLCPAQARGGERNARSDVYSLGCLLFQLLAGRLPFLGKSFEEVVKAHEQQPIPAIAAGLGLPAKIDDVLSGMLHKDPFFRFEGVSFALVELEKVREQLPLPAAAAPAAAAGAAKG